MTAARALLGFSYTATMLMLVLHPDHTMEPSWSLHAEIHLRQAVNWAVGLCATGLVMTAWGLRTGQPWVWWGLLLNAWCLFAGYGAPPVALAQGPFSPFDVWGLLALAGCNVLGLIAARRPSASAGRTPGLTADSSTAWTLSRPPRSTDSTVT